MDSKVLIIGDLCLKKEYGHDLADEELSKIMNEYEIISCDFGIPTRSSVSEGVIKVGPYESQSESSVIRCRKLGVNLVRLAGNHIMDYGIGGAQRLIDKLETLDIKWIGFSQDYRDAYNPVICSVNSIKLAFFSVGQMEFGCSHEKGVAGFAWVNSHELDRRIQEIRDQVDYIFVFPHAGVESVPVPMPEWRNRYYSLIDIGADFIIATHPHIIQGVEKYGRGIIAYSLGNFAYDYEKPDDIDDWNRSIGISFDLSLDGYSYEILPFQYENGTVKVVNDNVFRKKFEYANKLLADEDLYHKELDKACEELWYKYYYGYYTQNAVKGGGIINSAFLFHNIGIESHDYICRRALMKRMYAETDKSNNVMENVYLLWGAGKIGHAALRYCKKKHVRIAGVVDSNEDLSGKTVEEEQIINVENAMCILKEQPDIVVMACVGIKAMCEIKCMLFDKVGSRQCISYEDFRIRILKKELLEELRQT